MSRVAARHGAINLAQGFPDWDPPAALIEAGRSAMDAHRHQYAVTWGAPEMRNTLAGKLTRFMGVPVDADRGGRPNRRSGGAACYGNLKFQI